MKRPRILNRIAAVAVAAISLVVSVQTHASVVCFGSGGIANICHGVQYNGTTYDVTWALGSVSGTIPDNASNIFHPNTNLDPGADAAAVSQLIADALNAGPFTAIEYKIDATTTSSANVAACSTGSLYPCFSTVYRDLLNGTFSTQRVRYGDPVAGSWAVFAEGGVPLATLQARPIAVFTAAVPVPAALSLFLSGLAAVGWIGRRRRTC